MFQGAIELLGDLDHLDPDGMKAFTQTFEQKLKLPHDIMETIVRTFLKFGTQTVYFIFGALFLLIVIVVWVLVPMNYLSWGVALIITILVGLFFWIGAMVYRSVLTSTLNVGIKQINQSIGLFTEEFATNIFTTLSDATSQYAKNRKGRHKLSVVDPSEFEE